MSKGAADLEVWREAPVWELSSAGLLLHGNHQNKVWRGLAHPLGDTVAGTPMIVKWMASSVAIATELACALAAQALKLPIPPGRLVLADADQLNGLPARFEGKRVLCFGSQLQWPDDLAAFAHSDEAVEELIWNRLCDLPEGPSGAAWDELVANDDRHHENVLFDGRRWWLFDHEKALEPISRVMKRFAQQAARQQVIDHRSKRNQLATQLQQRRPNDHRINDQPAGLLAARRRLQWLADTSRTWRVGDDTIDGTLSITEVVLRSIELRLPALAQDLQARLAQPQGATLWDSSPQPPSSRKGSRRNP
jgi:hypothetical protein